MTYQERQAIASRGIGAPVPPAEPVQPPLAKSSDGTDWGAIAALVAVRQRHTPATPS